MQRNETMARWQKANSKEQKYFVQRGQRAFNSHTEKRIWDFESRLLQTQLELLFLWFLLPLLLLQLLQLLLLLLMLLLWSSCRYALTKLRCLRPAAAHCIALHCHAPF